MPNYQKGQIYTIRCSSNEDFIYVGSTTQELSKRIAQHRRQSYKHARKLYEYTNGNWEGWYIELYEDFPCENKKELDKREGEVIRLIGTLNKNIAGRSRQEYKAENVDKIKEYSKEYNKRPEVKLRAREYEKNYREKYKDKKAQNDKKYAEKNKDKIKDYQKEYREMNKDKMREYQKEYHLKIQKNNELFVEKK